MTATQTMSYGSEASTVPLKARTPSPLLVSGSSSHHYHSYSGGGASPVPTSSGDSPHSSEIPHSYPYYQPMAPPSKESTVIAPVPVPSGHQWGSGSPETVPLVSNVGATNAGVYNAPPKSPSTVKKVTTNKNKASGGGKPKEKKVNKSGDTVTARRQKRLERNRESARLSRRRRKQYLEVLEDRVSQLAIEMDAGRRAHAKQAIETVLSKRREFLERLGSENQVHLLDSSLSRTSHELAVVSTFHTQQLKSFSLPADVKFVLWLTLQGDTYFRGGRAASERLSAARIGERMLQSGNDKVTPDKSMWPLFCNEVGLSYDQEEKVRSYQKALVQDPNSWLDRHTARSSDVAMQSLHDSMNGVGRGLNNREVATGRTLTPAQRLKFLAWADKNKERICAKFAAKRQELGKENPADKFQLDKSKHIAANLYILNQRLQQVLKALPKPINVATPSQLKRLSRRPSFESLGQQKDEQGRVLSRDASFASSGSLKTTESSQSNGQEDAEKAPQSQVAPEDGEKAAQPTVDEALGYVKEIIPPPVTPNPLPAEHGAAPMAFPPAPPAPTPAPVFHFAPPAPAAATTHITHHQPQPVPVNMAPGQPHSYHEHMYYAPPPAQGPPSAHSQHLVHAPPPPPSHPQHLPHQSHQPHVYSAPHTAQPPQTVHYDHARHHVPYPHVAPHPHAASAPSPIAPAPMDQSAPAPAGVAAPPPSSHPGHARKSSFLPAHLNVVPEEMFPSTDGATEDFFMSLMDDEDWAIGGGVDMDTTH